MSEISGKDADRSNKAPTKDDVDLLLKLIELRLMHSKEAFAWVVDTPLEPDWKKFKEKYPPGSKEHTYVNEVIGWFETAIGLVELGLLNQQLFYKIVGVEIFWKKLEPIVKGIRGESLAVSPTLNTCAMYFEVGAENQKKYR
jgi:hypothetical protein